MHILTLINLKRKKKGCFYFDQETKLSPNHYNYCHYSKERNKGRNGQEYQLGFISTLWKQIAK